MSESSFVSADELIEKINKREKELNKIVKKDDDCIILHGYYYIEFDRFDTKEKILEWVIHLIEKRDMDSDIINRFIKMACDVHGIKYRINC